MTGLTSTGLVVKRVADVRTDLKAAAKEPAPDGFGAGVDTGDDGPLGKLIGLIAVELGSSWAALQQVYDAFDPDAAGNEALENLAALVGVNRLPATSTTVTLQVDGTAGTVIPAGSLARVANGPILETTEEVTLTGSPDDVAAQVVETGATEILATEVDTVVTAIAGWTSVDNAADGVTGEDLETDAELRLRREASLQSIGAGSVGAIRSKLLAITEIDAALVLTNRTLVVDSDGLPGKSFRAVVWSGSPAAADDDDIATAIFDSMPAGIYPDGTTVAAVTDDQGIAQTVRWDEASEQAVYVNAALTTGSDYPADGDDLVKAAIVTAAATLSIGDDVVLYSLLVATGAITGILTCVITALVGSAPGGGDTSDLAMANTQIATVAIGNVTVS